jgi:hypothetical protein
MGDLSGRALYKKRKCLPRQSVDVSDPCYYKRFPSSQSHQLPRRCQNSEVFVRVCSCDFVDRLLRPTKERSAKSHELTRKKIHSNPSCDAVSVVGGNAAFCARCLVIESLS